MWYRCTNCNTAIESKGTPENVCPICKKGNDNIQWVRAERNRAIDQLPKFKGKEIYRSQGIDWLLQGDRFKRLNEV
jgi:hypothetical protein